MTEPGFDDLIHAPHRLQICALLAASEASIEFGRLRDHLGVADSVLSKNLKALVDAGYVRLDKPTGTGGRPKTWAHLTRPGRRAFDGHLAALRAMVEAARVSAVPSTPRP